MKRRIPVNGTLIITLLTAGVLGAAGLTVLILMSCGIRREERQMSLATGPCTRAGLLARKVLGVHVSQPEARRVFSEGLTCALPPPVISPGPGQRQRIRIQDAAGSSLVTLEHQAS
jgi:hypothetical protein